MKTILFLLLSQIAYGQTVCRDTLSPKMEKEYRQKGYTIIDECIYGVGVSNMEREKARTEEKYRLNLGPALFRDTLITTHFYGLVVNDSTKTILTVESDSLGYDYKTLEITGDSIVVIKTLLSTIEENQKGLEVANAAEDILRCITVDGFVVNWEEWHKAVKQYKKLKYPNQ